MEMDVLSGRNEACPKFELSSSSSGAGAGQMLANDRNGWETRGYLGGDSAMWDKIVVYRNSRYSLMSGQLARQNREAACGWSMMQVLVMS